MPTPTPEQIEPCRSSSAVCRRTCRNCRMRRRWLLSVNRMPGMPGLGGPKLPDLGGGIQTSSERRNDMNPLLRSREKVAAKPDEAGRRKNLCQATCPSPALSRKREGENTRKPKCPEGYCLSRGGIKKRPFYRIVIADSRSPRDGRFIERLGTFDPRRRRTPLIASFSTPEGRPGSPGRDPDRSRRPPARERRRRQARGAQQSGKGAAEEGRRNAPPLQPPPPKRRLKRRCVFRPAVIAGSAGEIKAISAGATKQSVAAARLWIASLRSMTERNQRPCRNHLASSSSAASARRRAMRQNPHQRATPPIARARRLYNVVR